MSACLPAGSGSQAANGRQGRAWPNGPMRQALDRPQDRPPVRRGDVPHLRRPGRTWLATASAAGCRPGAGSKSPMPPSNAPTPVANSVGRCRWSSCWPPRGQERSQKQARRPLTPTNKWPTLNSPPVPMGFRVHTPGQRTAVDHAPNQVLLHLRKHTGERRALMRRRSRTRTSSATASRGRCGETWAAPSSASMSSRSAKPSTAAWW